MYFDGLAFCTVTLLYRRGVGKCDSAICFRSHDFVQGYGIQLADGPLRGLTARAVIVINENGKVRYTQLVKEVSNEPNYEAALQAANKL